jgi:hypothetical protein
MKKCRLFVTVLLVALIIAGCVGGSGSGSGNSSSSNAGSVRQDSTTPIATAPTVPSSSDAPATKSESLTSTEIPTQASNENEEDAAYADERLLGVWETTRGVPLWFFCSPTTIEFFPDGRVYETCCDKYATIVFDGDGKFILEGESGHEDTGGLVEGPFNFTYSFSGEQLTLIDQDGDSSTYKRG